jgi:2-polyprenyl-3-methyl-5-hydroxy-6-metoxy-1,4-benzoquinol methylase
MDTVFNKEYFEGKTSNWKYGYEIDSSNMERWKNRINIISKYVSSGKLLDLGCAYGYFLKYASRYFEVFGIDVSEYAIKRARKMVPKGKFFIRDISKKLRFNYKFDIITAFDSIEHTKSPYAVIDNVQKILKKDGIFFVQTPIKCWVRRCFGFLDKDKTHISILEESKFFEILKKNKFKILDTWRMIPLIEGKYQAKNALKHLGYGCSVIAQKL